MIMLRRWFRTFRRDDDAQDLVEYTLLIGFLALTAVVMLSQSGVAIQGPWATAQTTLAVATATPTAPPAPPPPGDGHGDHDGR
jgi:Flp pilus assembly pilin Flp